MLPAPDPVGIALTDEASCYIGEITTIKPTFIPTNAYSGLIWWAEDTTVATVNSEGIIKGISKGKTNIWVKTANGDFTDFCTMSVLDPSDIKYLVLWNHDGSTTAFPLEEHPVITYDKANGIITCKTSEQEVEFSLYEIYKYTLGWEEGSTGIDEVKIDTKGNVNPLFGNIIFEGFAPNTIVSIYSSNGVMIDTRKTDDLGKTKVSMSKWPKGIYIIKVGEVTHKIMKK